LCLQIPNVFSPNGDGVNHTWVIIAGDPINPQLVQEMYPGAIVQVYSRWGTLVFQSEPGYPTPWNGTYNGVPLPIDSYLYIITPRAGENTLCGNVTIIK
jgi:gliding motility-associated-like protein